MNFRTTFVLLVLLLGVGAYLMFSPGKSSDSSVQTSNPQKLLDISSNDVSKVIIAPAGGKRIVLERHTQEAQAPTIGPATSDWKITEPITAYADASKVSDLIDSLVNANSTSQVEIGSSAADYGLDTPQFTVDLEAGPKSVRLFIGRQVKAGNELYVQLQGKESTAEVVGADLLDKIDTTADKLRQAKLVNADVNAANWVSIDRPAGSYVLQKTAGTWEIALPTTLPTTQPAEQSAVGDLVSAINNAQAAGFAGPDDSEALLIGKPQATVKISTQAPSTQPAQTETIEFGALDSLVGKNVWVRVTPPGDMAKIPKDTMDSILKSPLDLRDRTICQVDPANVTEIRIVKNIPATTQPVEVPAHTQNTVLSRRPPRKIDLTLGPAAPTTQPTTGPSALASATQPSTQPAVAAATQPATVWQLTNEHVPRDADDSKVDTLLALFNPLKADKYLPILPPGKHETTYLVTITLAKGAPIDLEFSDPGEGSDSLVGVSGNLLFNCTRNLITSLDANFDKAAAAASAAPATPAVPGMGQ
jgi:hypothetical protein